MATTYLTPGVYVEEVPAGPRPIEAVGTSTAGFVGEAPDPKKRVNEVIAVNNWSEFLREYSSEASSSTNLSQAVYGFFQNGGLRCYIVNVGSKGSIAGSGRKREGLRLLETIDEIAIVAAPGYTDVASYDAVLSHCENLKDRVAILDGPQFITSINALTQVGTMSSSSSSSSSSGSSGAEGSEGSESSGGLRARQSDSGFGAFYFPYITVADPFTGELVDIPPSGHMAGIWARTDSTRGVHKAPANETVRGALNVAVSVTKEDQGELNPAGVNVIRFFGTEGIRVWGARTLADSASEWRYLNVRRLFNMIEESIEESTRWIVFEPNDRTLWRSIRRDVSAFLTRLWRDGALMGATPQEAFFVQCDEETNPPDVIDAGRVVTRIGIAPVKPAEFILFRISQFASGTEVEIEGGI